MERAVVKAISQERNKTAHTADVHSFLELFIAKRERQITEIELVVSRYEKKRHTEERASQSFSGIRKFFSGKKPDHHLAVEYIHYVKKPMEQVRMLRAEIDTAKQMMVQANQADILAMFAAADGTN
jgi:hypothetical protein